MAKKKAEIKLITVVSNSSGRVAHYTIDGKGASKRFPVDTTDADLRKKLGVGKAAKKKTDDKKADDKKKEVSDEIIALREEAKALGVQATHFMTSKETLLAKIAEAKAGSEEKK